MLNLDSLKDVVGNDEDLMAELLVQFLTITQNDMRMLQDAVAAESARDIASLAHRIKGSCYVVGANRLAELLGDLEQHGLNDNRDEFPVLSKQATEEFSLVRKEIETLIP